MELIQVDILALTQSRPNESGAFALVLGEVDGNRRLPIIIGLFEAQAIALELEKLRPPRPMTHDLLRDLMVETGSEMLDVIIHELREGTFYASIRFSCNGKEACLDARPSDAVALAVRFGVAIFVSPSVLNDAGIPMEDETAAEGPPSETPSRQLSPIEDMERLLTAAIAQEDYEEAARLRDALAELKRESS